MGGAAANLPEVCVHKLCDWINGPLAKAWQPYSLSKANCQHFVLDVLRFLCNPEAISEWSERENKYVIQQALLSSNSPEEVLRKASAEMLGDPEVGLVAVTAKGDLLQYLAPQLRSDRIIV